VRFALLLGVAACALALSGCGSSAPQRMADATTRAVYSGDRDGVVSNFDDGLRAQVTREEIGAISDYMHGLGTYKGLQPTDSNADSGRYDYQANFDKGSMLVQIRLDPGGKLAAYRVVPQSQGPATANNAGSS